MIRKYFDDQNIPSLEDVLLNREKRVEKIRKLQEEFPHGSILCFKLNIPGGQKTNDAIIKIFDHGKDEIRKLVGLGNILFEQAEYTITGPEYFLALDLEGRSLKKEMIVLEDDSYFGRLYDIDILYKGENISRQDLSYTARKCFICDNDAKVCSSRRAHSVDEMISWIENLIDEYKGEL